MSDTMLMWTEIIFDVLYLLAIWLLVILMWNRRAYLNDETRKVGQLFIAAFFLLALGDTGHVGFRVVAYARGGLAANPSLVGMGALATAVTVTFFYMVVAEIWRVRFGKPRNAFWWSLIIIGFIRLIIMIPAGNDWGSAVTPLNWSLARNIPLMIQGLAIAVALLVSGIRAHDRMSIWVGIMIFVSYAFYTPVILFVQKIPLLGMLMMPKTLAYVAVALIAFRLFRKPTSIEG